MALSRGRDGQREKRWKCQHWHFASPKFLVGALCNTAHLEFEPRRTRSHLDARHNLVSSSPGVRLTNALAISLTPSRQARQAYQDQYLQTTPANRYTISLPSLSSFLQFSRSLYPYTMSSDVRMQNVGNVVASTRGEGNYVTFSRRPCFPRDRTAFAAVNFCQLNNREHHFLFPKPQERSTSQA